MSNWLPWALVVFFVILLAAMPWQRTHPNHEFMLDLLRLLEDEDAAVLGSSSSGARPDKIEAEGFGFYLHNPVQYRWKVVRSHARSYLSHIRSRKLFILNGKSVHSS
jgi:hypothetical protein